MAETWEEASGEAAAKILDWKAFGDVFNAPLTIASYLDTMQQTKLYSSLGFQIVGAHALRQYALMQNRDPAMVMKEILAVVVGKQYDYGPQNILWGGAEGIALRMHDKLARIENMEKMQRGEAANEPLLDSWLDLVGYSIVAVMLKDGTFELPLLRDIHPTNTLTALEGELEGDADFRNAFRQFNAATTKPQYVERESDDHYTIEGGGTLIVDPAPDGNSTKVTFTDGEGGAFTILAEAGQISIEGDQFVLNSQRLSVVLCMLLGAAEAALDWRDTNVTAYVPREELP